MHFALRIGQLPIPTIDGVSIQNFPPALIPRNFFKASNDEMNALLDCIADNAPILRHPRTDQIHFVGSEKGTHHQYICCPPLIDSVLPVMNPPSSATRNSTARAISSARPRRPTGMRATILASTSVGTAATMSVSM